jgi:hypothetical protein
LEKNQRHHWRITARPRQILRPARADRGGNADKHYHYHYRYCPDLSQHPNKPLAGWPYAAILEMKDLGDYLLWRMSERRGK